MPQGCGKRTDARLASEICYKLKMTLTLVSGFREVLMARAIRTIGVWAGVRGWCLMSEHLRMCRGNLVSALTVRYGLRF